MKVCLVNDTSDDSNWGGRATSLALRELVESIGAKIETTVYQYDFSFPFKTDIVNLDQESTERYSLDELIDVAPRHWGDFERCAIDVMNGVIFGKIRQALDTCEVVLISGEGCIYDRTRQSRMIFFIAYLAKKFFGKKTAIVNHSVVLNDRVLMEIARHVYPLLDDVVFREPESAMVCPGNFGKIAADAAYQFTPTISRANKGNENLSNLHHMVNELDLSKPYACVGGGSVYFRGIRPDVNPIPSLTLLCRELLNEVGQVLLTASSEKDLKLFEPISKELSLPLLEASVPVKKAVDLVGNAAVYIGARWHPSIFAHSGGTPVIALDKHTTKMMAFIKQAGFKQEVLDPFAIDIQVSEIMKYVKFYVSQGDDLRKELRYSAARLNLLSKKNIDVLMD